MKKIEDKILIDSYHRTGNVWKTAEEVGLCGQSVYERLSKLCVVKRMNLWTDADDDVLREKYLSYKFANRLDALANELGRTKQFICRKARALGLTDRSNKAMSLSARRKASCSAKRWIAEKGHPRGMLGKVHSEHTKSVLSSISRQMWKNPDSRVNSDEHRQLLSDNLHKRKMDGSISVFSIKGFHKGVIGGISYVFKSSWEMEIAARLQKLLEDGLILHWGYETTHFDFPDVRRGIRSYCPDFEVTLLDGSKKYLEVKGWKMEQSMKRIEMFRERYVDVKFCLIDEYEYRKIISEGDYLWRCCL